MVLAAKRVINPVLTTLAQGFTNAEYVGHHLFPEVYVDKEGGQIPQFGADHFKLWGTKRAPKAKSNRGQINDPAMIDIVLTEHDFELTIDYREDQESMFNEKKRKSKSSKDVVDLGKEYAQAQLAQNADNYPSGHKVTLTTTDKWSNHDESDPATASDPLGDVETGKEKIRSKIGRKPNVAAMGASTYEVLKFHPALLAKMESNKKGLMTIEDLQELFGIKKIVVGEAVYADDDGNLGNDIWSDVFIMAYVPEQKLEDRDAEEPCFGRTPIKRNSQEVDSYTENGGKVIIVRYTEINTVVITGAIAGYIISDCK